MIKFKDIRLSNDSLFNGKDVIDSLSVDNNIDKDKFKVNIILHDGYKISLVDVHEDKVISVKIGDSIEKMDMNELFDRFLYVYPLSTFIRSLPLDDHLFADARIYGHAAYDSGESDNTSMIIGLPKQILDIATKLGFTRESFLSDIVFGEINRRYRILSTKEYMSDKKILRSIHNLREEYLFRDLFATKPGDLGMKNGMIISCIDVILTDYVTKVGAFFDKNFINTKILLNDRLRDVFDILVAGFQIYCNHGSKEGLRYFYNYLLENMHDHGLLTMMFVNELERKINEFGFKELDALMPTNIMETLVDNVKDVLLDIDKMTFQEAAEMFGQENASQAVEVYNNVSIPIVYDEKTYEPNLITPESQDNINLIMDSDTVQDFANKRMRDMDKEFEVDVKGLQQLHLTNYMHKLKDFRDITAFETPEEKEALVQKLVGLVDDMRTTKNELSRGASMEYPTDDIDLSLYDVMIKNATEHIDFLQNINLYGTNTDLSKFNLDKHASSLAEAYDYSGRSIFYKIGRKLFSYDILDKDGNVIRNSWDPKTLENLSSQEKMKFEKYILRSIQRPTDFHAYIMPVLRPFLNVITKSIDSFYGGILNVIEATLKVGKHESFDFSNYPYSEDYFLDRLETEFYEYYAPYYEGSKLMNSPLGLGDIFDNIVFDTFDDRIDYNKLKKNDRPVAMSRGQRLGHAVKKGLKQSLDNTINAGKAASKAALKGAKIGAKVAGKSAKFAGKAALIGAATVGGYKLYKDGVPVKIVNRKKKDDDVLEDEDLRMEFDSKELNDIEKEYRELASSNESYKMLMYAEANKLGIWSKIKFSLVTDLLHIAVLPTIFILKHRPKPSKDDILLKKLYTNEDKIFNYTIKIVNRLQELLDLDKENHFLGNMGRSKVRAGVGQITTLLRQVDKAKAKIDDKPEPKAKSESGINSINKLTTRVPIDVKYEEDGVNLVNRLYNTAIKIDEKLLIQGIDIEEYKGLWAFINTNKGDLVFNLDKAYKSINKNVIPSDVNGIPVSVFTMGKSDVIRILKSKNKKGESIEVTEARQILNTSDKEDERHAAIKSLEEDVIKRVAKMPKGNKNGRENKE